MRPTVQTPVSPKKPDTLESLLYWQNKEASPLMDQARTALNSRELTKKTLTTAATGVLTTIFSEELPFTGALAVSGAWAVDAHILGRATAGGAAHARYELSGLFWREAGGAMAQEGATVVLVAIESIGALDATLSASANSVIVQVKDDGVRTVAWSCVVEIAEVLG